MEEVKKDEKAENINEDKIDTREDAKIIEEEKKQRVTQCSQEIVIALKKYNCDFDVTMLLGQNRILPNIQIVAK